MNMKNLLFTSLLASVFFACGPSAEELEEHEKKVESETLKLDDEWLSELDSMSAEVDTIAADSTKK